MEFEDSTKYPGAEKIIITAKPAKIKLVKAAAETIYPLTCGFAFF
jgi:hypothetical protein